MRIQNPRTADASYIYVWISPDGKFYDGDAHINRAVEILYYLYGIEDRDHAADKLEELGWIRAAGGMMWDLRVRQGYYSERNVTQKQIDALYDWCTYHNLSFIQLD